MQRVAFVMRVKEGQQEEYIRRHQQVWQEVLADLQRAGVQKNEHLYVRASTLSLHGGRGLRGSRSYPSRE